MAGFNPVIAPLGDNKRDIWGGTDIAVFTMTFAAGDTYLTNGMALTQANFGMERPIAGMKVIGYNTAGFVIDFFWNTQTQKLQARWVGPATSGVFAEVANTTPIAGFAITVLVIGQR